MYSSLRLRYQVSNPYKLNISFVVFWVVTPCSLASGYEHFVETPPPSSGMYPVAAVEVVAVVLNYVRISCGVLKLLSAR
jgi:hypothetical protein